MPYSPQQNMNKRLPTLRIMHFKQRLAELSDQPRAQELLTVAEQLVVRSVWIIGGDGWAYDIGYGGLDHVARLGA